MSSETQATSGQERDSEDLARFGYSQELKRSLGLFSSFAVAFSYISPSTGIFTLFALGLSFIGAAFFWTWPIVFLGQLFIALNFAELSSHFPIAGSVFQWTKYLSGRSYAWFTGWIYLAAGVPVIATRVSGNIGMLGSGYPGYYRLGDARSLARQIRRAALDPAYYGRLRRLTAARRPLFRPAAERDKLRKLLAEFERPQSPRSSTSRTGAKLRR